MNNLKIGTKLSIGFGILIVALVVVAFVAIQSLKGVEADTDNLLKKSF
jgi:CHASE3 domain sensor protein